MPLYRVLFSWLGGGRPYAPNTILELEDDAETASRVEMGAIEAVSEETAELYGYDRNAAPPAEDAPSDESNRRDLGALVNRNVGTVATYLETASAGDVDLIEELETARGDGPRVGVRKAIETRRRALHLEAVAPVVEAMNERDRQRAEADEGEEPPEYLESLERDAFLEHAALFGVEVPDGFDFADADERVELMLAIAEAAAEAAEALADATPSDGTSDEETTGDDETPAAGAGDPATS